ncbi:MAG: methyltransferase domain-containing protein, partial [Candidatus Sumerlaeia bacterium]|nr:methyltransferase domain-containing protein [Candidatus Sumerlaeia bacterium]
MYRPTLEKICCPVCPDDQPLMVGRMLERAPDGEMVAGVLTCSGCGRWFRVQDGIADLVRDELREVEEEALFLETWKDALSGAVLKAGPGGGFWRADSVTEADQRIIDEGRHWGRFMGHFWDVGDRAIFDIRERGSHPRFFVAGILERDDRDTWRKWGFYTPRSGEMLFSRLGDLHGKWGLDVGCGGGQFGLEAARQGVRMIGFDPSFEEIALGRQHARETGLRRIDYIRAEPEHPPFRREHFSLLMAKDSLHHVPDLEKVLPKLVGLLDGEGTLVTHEHVARAGWKEFLMNRIRPAAIAKIRRRYPSVEIPAELLR